MESFDGVYGTEIAFLWLPLPPPQRNNKFSFITSRSTSHPPPLAVAIMAFSSSSFSIHPQLDILTPIQDVTDNLPNVGEKNTFNISLQIINIFRRTGQSVCPLIRNVVAERQPEADHVEFRESRLSESICRRNM